MTKLKFRGSKTLQKLAQRTIEEEKFIVPYTKKISLKRSFCLVKDEGIYLMNNYISDKKEKNLVVYAQGFNPKTNKNVWEDSYNAVGGDDFGESIPLSLGQLYRIAEGGGIDIDIDEASIRWTA
jgi:hypothetical protein